MHDNIQGGQDESTTISTPLSEKENQQSNESASQNSKKSLYPKVAANKKKQNKTVDETDNTIKSIATSIEKLIENDSNANKNKMMYASYWETLDTMCKGLPFTTFNSLFLQFAGMINEKLKENETN